MKWLLQHSYSRKGPALIVMLLLLLLLVSFVIWNSMMLLIMILTRCSFLIISPMLLLDFFVFSSLTLDSSILQNLFRPYYSTP